MIHDLSQTLKEFLDAELPEPLGSVEIVFDRPDDKFNPSQMTVDLFLYDIHENIQLRDNEPIIDRQDGQVTIRRPPLRLACSYLITAWPVGGSGLPGLPLELPLQEQYLLSQVLSILSKNPVIPDKFLQGSLKGQKPDLPMIVAQTEEFKNPAEFWTAIGNKMRPSFTLTVTISIEMPSPDMPAFIVTSNVIRLGQRTSPATQENFFRIEGRITNSSNEPVKNATVILVELGIVTKSDTDGHYILGPITSAGDYELRVQSASTAPTSLNVTIPAWCKDAVPPVCSNNYDLMLE